MAHSNETHGDLMRPFLIFSTVQFTVQMSKLNGFGKTHRERKFVVEVKFKNWFIRQRAFIEI